MVKKVEFDLLIQCVGLKIHRTHLLVLVEDSSEIVSHRVVDLP